MKKLIYVLLFFALCCLNIAAQDKSPVEVKAKKISDLNRSIADTEAEIQALAEKKAILEQERKDLLAEVSRDMTDVAFQNSPPSVVVNVDSGQMVRVLINGSEKRVYLHGILVQSAKSLDAALVLKRRLADGLVYIRCASEICSEGYLYLKKDEESLNTQLVREGFAWRTGDAKFDLANSNLPVMDLNNGITAPSTGSVSTSATTTSSSGTSSKTTPGSDVYVKGYYRKDGTYVHPYTRSAPSRKH